jgi:hypothetical protein
MKRTWWMTQAGCGIVVVVAVAMLTGVAWADPVGTANVPQILNARTVRSAGLSEQRTFRTTDGNIIFTATYYDSNPTCVGVAPLHLEFFAFNSEGVLVRQSDLTGQGPGPGSHYTNVNVGIDAGTFAGPGTYSYSYLTRDCTNAISLVLTPFATFRLVAP